MCLYHIQMVFRGVNDNPMVGLILIVMDVLSLSLDHNNVTICSMSLKKSLLLVCIVTGNSTEYCIVETLADIDQTSITALIRFKFRHQLIKKGKL